MEEGTNLQLYSLRCAWNEFQELRRDSGWLSDGAVRERGAHIAMSLALSLTQLLGQNCVAATEKVGAPHQLWKVFWRQHGLHDNPEILSLTKKFEEVIEYYDAIHHFGRTPSGTKHDVVSDLDLPKVESLVESTIQIWDRILEVFRIDGHHLDFSSVKDLLGTS